MVASSDQADDANDNVSIPVNTPTKTITKTYVNNDADGSGDVSVGDTITYTYTVTNTGTANLTGVGVLDTPLGAITLTDVATNGVDFMAPGDVETGTAIYVVQTADLGGNIVNAVVASSDQAPDADASVSIPVPNPLLSVVKNLTSNADEDGSLDVSANDTLTYMITATNTGSANLTDIVVSDNLTGASITCAGPVVPNGTCVLTTTYTVQDTDVGTTIANIGTANSYQTGPVTEPENVPVPSPSLIIDKVVDSVTNPDGSLSTVLEVDEADDVIAYTITATNNGNANLTNVTVDDDLTGANTSCALVLAAANNDGVPGTCELTTTYTATQDDLDNDGTNPTLNGLIDNTATGDSVQTGSVDDSEQVPVVQLPAHTLTKDFDTSSDPDQIGDGETGTFTLVYTNIGNVTLSSIIIEDEVDPRLVVDGFGTPSVGSCTDPDTDPQTISCNVDSLAPGDSVTITVDFTALGEALLPEIPGQISGASYVFFFENNYVLYGSTFNDTATLLDENRKPVTGWDVDGVNQDIFLTVPYGGGDDGGFYLHLSCSDPYIDGWGEIGPIEGEDDPDWRVNSYTVERFNSQGFLKDCTQTFAFDVFNTASAEAIPAGGNLDPNPITDSDTLTVINIAPIEVTRERIHKGDVGIQYFNTSYEAITLEIIQVEWDATTDPETLLEFASYQDGVLLEIGSDTGLDNGCEETSTGICRLSASISTLIEARDKDWLKLSFNSQDAPVGLTVTIVTDTGAIFTYVYGL